MSETFAFEGLLWDAACSKRGSIDAHKFNDCIIPLLFYKRLCVVYEDELKDLGREYCSVETSNVLVKSDRKLIRFYISDDFVARARVRIHAEG